MSDQIWRRHSHSALTARFIGRQMWADGAALAVALIVVALAAFLTASIPPAVDGVVAAQVRESVDQAGTDAQVVVTVPIGGADSSPFELAPGTADQAEYFRTVIDKGMPPDLASVLEPPVTTFVSIELKAGTIADQPARVRFAYVASDSGPAVEWVAGREPASTGVPSDLGKSPTGLLPMEVGLSEQVAALMGLTAGDTIPVVNQLDTPLDVRVSGVYHAVDPLDPAWATVPTLLQPQTGVGYEHLTTVALLTSAESLPFALINTFPDGMSRFYTYPVNADAITSENIDDVKEQARGLATGKQAFKIVGATPTTTTRLDVEIGRALVATTAATAQASVTLVAMVALAIAVELVAAGLLVGRRQTVLAQARSRGASAAIVARALALESGLVVILGGALGVFAAHATVEGDTPWGWVLPPLIVAFAAAPVLAARRVTRKQDTTPAKGLRRIALEVALVALAAGSTASLVTRGVSASEGAEWADLLVLAAPVLCALAVAVLMLRVLPPLTRWARAAATRADGPAALLATARSRITASAICALVLAASVGSMAATTGATVSRGLGSAADYQVGADVIARAAVGQSLPDAVAEIGDDGEIHSALAYVVPNAQLVGLRVDKPVTLVAVDAEDFDAMRTANGDPPLLGALAKDGDGQLPMLVSAGDADLKGVALHANGLNVPAHRVGPGVAMPGVSADDRIVVVVDRSALAKTLSTPVPATFLWATGPGAEQAVRAAIGDAPATIITRDEWLQQQVSSPVAKALHALFIVAVGVAVVLGLLAAGLIAASGVAERRRATGRLRVLGLPRARAWRIAQAELTIPLFVASVIGVVVGVILAIVVRGPLGLTSITGQRYTPDPVVPWWLVLIPVVIAGLTWIAVGFGARADRGRNLGQVLRTD